MRIALTAQHLCVRASQMGLAAKRFGHEVHLILHPESMGRQFNEKFDSLQVWHSKEQLAAAIRRVQPDIIHTQDRPHLLTVEVIELGLGIPVVQDVHDMDSMLDMPMGHPLAEAGRLAVQPWNINGQMAKLLRVIGGEKVADGAFVQ